MSLSPRRFVAIAVAVAVASAATVASCSPHGQSRYQRKAAQESLKKLGTPGLVIGEFHLTKITDGDTIRVDGLDSALRLVGLDAEETFKNDDDRRQADADFHAYLVRKRGDGLRPVKAATPMGDAAKEFAKQFFAGVSKVRLERDDPRELRDRYDRYLAYVFVEKNGRWINYNVECVRAGMSPYFTKYGNSRRFHDEFVAAAAEAKAAGRGIHDPTLPHYLDYDERQAWWDARGEFVARYQRQADADPSFIVLTHWDSMRRLEERVGKEVSILATVGDVRLGDRGPTRVSLSRKMFGDFPLVFFDKDVFASSGIAAWKGEFVVVKGVVTVYQNKHTKKKQLQIVVDRPGQIILSPVPGLTRPEAVTPASDGAAAL
ncbi:MAG TPA: thermonuclease family protein [Kofleriaceae bacterium]|nr:thermonuclease family protein [Kofleriaceae bacterium]